MQEDGKLPEPDSRLGHKLPVKADWAPSKPWAINNEYRAWRNIETRVVVGMPSIQVADPSPPPNEQAPPPPAPVKPWRAKSVGDDLAAGGAHAGNQVEDKVGRGAGGNLAMREAGL